jgi:hypothetical protein
MAITALPTPPNRNMTPEEFIIAADAFLEALPQFQEEANAAAEAMNLNDTSGTSATSNSIGTGAKTFTANTGKSWLPGMFIVIADTAAPSTNSMIAQVTSYNSGTGALVVDVKGTLGSGTKTAWTISQTSNPIPLDGSVSTAKLAAGVANGLTGVTIDPTADYLVVADASDSGNVKKGLATALVGVSGDQNVAGVKTFSSMPVLPSLGLVRLNTANGYGSTNTKIRRFTNVVTNQGTDITYADSATGGSSFTINKAGRYAISYTDNFNAAASLGISLNSAQLTTNVDSITISTLLAHANIQTINTPNTISVTLELAVNDVIRPHTNGTAVGTGVVLFTIQRVS